MLGSKQKEQYAGIKIAASGCHRNAAGGSQSHRCIDRHARTDCTKAGAATEVCKHDALRKSRAEMVNDGLIRKPVKSVATHARVSQVAGQRDNPLHFRTGRVKFGVEAAYLGKLRAALEAEADGLEIERLVHRRKGDELLQFMKDAAVEENRRGEPGAAVRDAMPDPLSRFSTAMPDSAMPCT